MNDTTFRKKYHDACVLLTFAAVVCTIQARRGKSFLFEQPWNALSWNESSIKRLLNEPGTMLIRTDQCMFGQKDLNQQPIRKRTGFLTNHVGIAAALKRTCKNNHVHQQCVGSIHGHARASQAARYPTALIDAVLRAFAKSGPNKIDQHQVHLCSVAWQHECPDGSKRNVRRTQVFRSQHANSDVSTQHDDGFVADPTEQIAQFLAEPTFEQFAVQDIANAEADASHQPLTEEESQAVELLSPAQHSTTSFLK